MSDPEVTDEAETVEVGAPESGDGASGSDDGGAPNAVAVLEYLVKQVVDAPDAVSVSTSEGRRGNLQLDVRVGDGDMGRVIGKRGRIAQSIRTVVRAAAVKDEVSVDIEFVD